MTDWLLPAAGLSLGAAAVAGSLFDIRSRRLPNWLSLVTLVAGLGTAAAIGGLPALGAAMVHFLIALTLGIALTAAGVIGAGDAKFYSAVASFFPWQQALILIGSIGVGALLLLVVWFMLRGFRGSGNLAAAKGVQLPFGVAIAIGAVLAWIAPATA